MSRPYYPTCALTHVVWALPVSLATTPGIDVSFSSCRYLDVSVPCVCPDFRRCQAFRLTGCPIRIPPDRNLFAVPRGFSQLTASFFASRSLGIRRPPLFPSVFFESAYLSVFAFREIVFADLFFFLTSLSVPNIVKQLVVFPTCHRFPFFSNGLQRYALFNYLQIFLQLFFQVFCIIFCKLL